MGRHRKPTAVLELEGAFRHNPHRLAERIAQSESNGPLGSAPAHFTEDVATIWDELAAMAPAGVLATADRWLVEITCQLMGMFRKNPVAMTASDLNLLVSCLARMGLTPSDRSKVGVSTAKETAVQQRDELAELAAASRASSASSVRPH